MLEGFTAPDKFAKDLSFMTEADWARLHKKDKQMSKHKVIVGNIGTVVTDGTYTEAMEAYRDYRQQSVSGVGRAAGESVLWLKDDEVYMEHRGTHEQDS